MMISPDGYIAKYEYMSYAELLPVRDRLISDIQYFEKHRDEESEIQIRPSPEVIYQCKLLYLSKLSELIMEKYNEEYIRGGADR